MGGMQSDLPRPTSRDHMEKPDVLEISCGDDVHLHKPPPPPTLQLCENSLEVRRNPGNGGGGGCGGGGV